MKVDGKKQIAIFTASMDVDYSVDILRGILAKAEEYLFDISIFNAFATEDEIIKHNKGEYNIYTLANLEHFDGVILFANLITAEEVSRALVRRLESAGIPVICVDDPQTPFPSVCVENCRSMKNIVDHMIEHHGFTEIAFITGAEDNLDSIERLEGYRVSLAEHGISPEKERVFYGRFLREHGRGTALQMLSDREAGTELPQAVVCGSDSIAIGFCEVMREHGIRVPEDIAVAGFDNIFEAKNSVPRLTTVDRRLEELGEQAMWKLKRCMDGEDATMCDMLPTTPVFSESCGCPGEKTDGLDLRLEYLKVQDRFERYLVRNTFMTEELNDSTSFDDMLKRVRGYMDMLGGERFYLCLDSGLVRYLRLAGKNGANAVGNLKAHTKGFAPVMSVVLAYERGECVEYDDFPTGDMRPDIKLSAEKSHVFVFSPVHFRDRSYGYVIVEGSDFVLNSMLYRNWLINLTNGLENVRKQANLQKTLQRLDRLYVTDPLTGLYNRYGFARYTSESFRICAREKAQVMVFFADMDGLKKINDQYGHDRGDAAIVAIADALRAACLAGEVCARFGGDEYVVYAEEYSEAQARRFCARFESWLEHYNMKQEQPFFVGASYGYQVFVPKEDDLIDKYIDRADERMYDAKRAKYQSRNAGV